MAKTGTLRVAGLLSLVRRKLGPSYYEDREKKRKKKKSPVLA
jgi:hypothetical protein